MKLNPNILWNYTNGWITFSHTIDNASFENYNISIIRGFEFLIIQIVMLGPFLFVAFLINYNNLKSDFQNKFLLCFSIPIILIVFSESILVRANANWAAPALLPLMILFFRSIKKHKGFLISFNFFINFIIGCLLYYSISINSSLKAFDRISGVKEFAFEIINSSDKKNLVVSDRLLFSSLSYELRKQGIKIFMPHKPGGPITNHFQTDSALHADFNEGFVMLGDPQNISYLSNKYKVRFVKKFKKRFINESIFLYEVVF